MSRDTRFPQPAAVEAAEGCRSRSEGPSPGEDAVQTIASVSIDLLFKVDANLVFEWASPSFQDVLGVSPREVIGTPLKAWVHPEDLERAQAIVAAARDSMAPSRILVRLRRGDGSYLPVEAAGRFVTGPDGKVVGAVVVGRDATHRLRAESELRESEQRYRSTLDAMGDLIHVVDSDLRIILANRRLLELNAVHGLATDVLGRTPFEVYPFLFPHVRDEYRRVLAEGQTLVTHDLTVLGGRKTATETRKIPLWQGGRVTQVVTVVRDVTEEHLAERERRVLEGHLQNAQRLESLGLLAGGVAHQFNNLLMAIIGNADLASILLPPSVAVQPYLREIIAASERAAELVRQILAYAGKGELLVRPCDLSELVARMAPMLQVAVGPEVKVRWELTSSPPKVAVDTSQLQQVLLSLVTNAGEALQPSGGSVTVSTGGCRLADRSYLPGSGVGLAAGDYAILRVADTGCGISKDALGKVFDPFYTTKFTGRGLGLAASLGIAKAHGGGIAVQSAPGTGSVFTVYMPVLAPHLDVQPAVGDPSKVGPGSGMVLVVDDEPAVREVTAHMLAECGFAVVSASDGEAALRLLATHEREIVGALLDFTMPRQDGRQLLTELRRLRPELPAVVMSGQPATELAAALAGIPGLGVLTKPFQIAELEAALRRVVETG